MTRIYAGLHLTETNSDFIFSLSKIELSVSELFIAFCFNHFYKVAT